MQARRGLQLPGTGLLRTGGAECGVGSWGRALCFPQVFVQVHAKTGLCYLAEVDSLQAVPYAASSTPLA